MLRSGLREIPGTSLRGAEAIQNPVLGPWIASRILSSGAHSCDPLARNDDKFSDARYVPERPIAQFFFIASSFFILSLDIFMWSFDIVSFFIVSLDMCSFM